MSATLDVLDPRAQPVDVAVRFVPIARGTGLALFEEAVPAAVAPEIAARLHEPADLLGQTLLTIDEPGHANTPTVDWSPGCRSWA